MKAPQTTASIIDGYDLYFDGGDGLNGSLYICVPREAAAPDAAVAKLRDAALWSDTPTKSVADDQRQAYKDGLAFVSAVTFIAKDGGELVAARFDHPKFPSDAERWKAWLTALDQEYRRVD